MDLIFDVATTRFRPGLSLTERPHIVRLAWEVTDSGNPTVSTLVRPPPNVSVGDDEFRFHGISADIARSSGVELGVALGPLLWEIDRLDPTDRLVCFNAGFHVPSLSRAIEDSELSGRPGLRLEDLMSRTVCLMKAAKNRCRIPGRHGDFKFPSLIEAHQTLLGEAPDIPREPVRAGLAIIASVRRLNEFLAKETTV